MNYFEKIPLDRVVSSGSYEVGDSTSSDVQQKDESTRDGAYYNGDKSLSYNIPLHVSFEELHIRKVHYEKYELHVIRRCHRLTLGLSKY